MTYVPLDELPDTQISPAATMYVPPLRQREPDPDILNWFDETDKEATPPRSDRAVGKGQRT